jgi:predicted nucleic acid-binding protein
MSVFLDANILFSGSNPDSSIHRLLLWLNGKERLVTSSYTAMEASRNISAKRPLWEATHKTLMACISIVPDAVLYVEAGLPDKDKPVLAAAIAAKCEYLVTGDKRDFGHLYGKTIEGVMVVSVLEFAEAMMKKHTT